MAETTKTRERPQPTPRSDRRPPTAAVPARTTTEEPAHQIRPLPNGIPSNTVGPMGGNGRGLQQLQQAAGNQALSRLIGPAVEPPVNGASSMPGVAEPTAEAEPAPAETGSTAAQPPPAPSDQGEAPAAPETPAEITSAEASPEAEATPDPREAIAPAIGAVQNRAATSRQHSPAATPVASAQAAAVNPQTEQTRSAAAQTVANLDEAEAREIERQQFKNKLKQAIDEATPKPRTESEAKRVMQSGAAEANNALRGELATERGATVGPMQAAANTEVAAAEQPAPPQTELQPEQAGPPPPPVSAAPVVPEPLPPERLDYSSDRAPTDQLMAENEVTSEQLEAGNEPAFAPTLEARGTAEEHEATAADRYRQSEAEVQAQAQGQAQQTLNQGVTGFHDERQLRIEQVAEEQTETQSKDAAERERITNRINTIKENTRTEVNAILNAMETEATNLFETGLSLAETAYKDAFEEAKGGIGTWLTTWGSDWDRHIEASLATARRRYLREVDKAIDNVANLVATKLVQARQRVAAGRQEVEDFVMGLDDSVRQYGEDALAAVSAEFDAMESEIDQRRDGLVNNLTQQYKDSYERMSAMEEELREANKSLWQRVYDATVGLVRKIIEFKNMLLDVLARAANVIGDIIAHPIRFLGNLISGVKLGLDNFIANIGTHLQKALMDWLFGTLAEAGIQLPERFDMQGILSLVLQVLGLTYANIRRRAVDILGEELVSRLEQVAEIFKILITEGPGGLWEYIKEKIGDLKTMVIEAIKSYVIEKIVIAGIKWVIGLLNPASAFIKACMAIYDIVKFFIERGSQILALINAIIDSLGAIVKGNISVAAKFVEDALAKALPVVIGFLAGLLGLGDISAKIRSIIEQIQRPINAAIDWVIHQAVKLVKAAGEWLGFGEEDAQEKDEAGEMDSLYPGVSEEFKTEDKKQHQLSIDPGQEEELILSSRPLSYTQFVNNIDPGNDSDKIAAQAAAARIVREFYQIRMRPYPVGISEADREKMLADKRRELDDKLAELWVQTNILLGSEGDIPTGDSAADAIPIIWYKPLGRSDLYPPLRIPGDDGRLNTIDVYDSLETISHPLEPGLRITIGVNRSKNEVRPGDTFLRLPNTRGTKTNQFRYILELLGVDLSGLDADHILDLNFGGEDNFDNIWMFDRGANRSAGARQNHQIVTYRDSATNQVRALEAGHPELVGKFYRVEQVEL